MAVSAAVVSESQGSSSHGAQHLTCGKHEEIPEAFPLPTEVDIVRAAAGWAHCIAATAFGEVYTWGLKECIPLGKVIRDHLGGGSLEKDDEHTRSFNGQDTGAVLTFGWGLYGQCGLGNTDDELTPLCVSSLLGVKMRGIAAGSWHTVCAFGGNQFGQLGTGSDQAEIMGRYSVGDGTNMASSAWVMLSTGIHHLMSPSRPAILHMWPVVGGTHSYLQSLPPESDFFFF